MRFRTLQKNVFGTAQLASLYLGENPDVETIKTLLSNHAGEQVRDHAPDFGACDFPLLSISGIFPILAMFCDRVFTQPKKLGDLKRYVHGSGDSFVYRIFYAPQKRAAEAFCELLSRSRPNHKCEIGERKEYFYRVDSGQRLVVVHFPFDCLPGRQSLRPTYAPLEC